MMKTQDVRVATALVLQGYMRANDDTKDALAEGIAAIRQETDDWSENLEQPDDGSALEPHQLTTAVREVIPMSIVDGGPPIKRTPYNLVSAAIALLGEAVDLSGPEIVLADFQKRSTELSVDKRPAATPASDDRKAALIGAANSLAASIDLAEERPVALLAAWHAAWAELRSMGMLEEDLIAQVVCPANW